MFPPKQQEEETLGRVGGAAGMDVEGSSACGVSSNLRHLPSRGYFSSSVPSSTPGGLRVYICDHETSPPGEQFIKTDTTNILIRSLTLNKGKGDEKSKDKPKPAETLKGKRPAERPAEEKAPVKKANTRKDASSSRPSERELQSYTVDKLKSLLKERGLPLKGKKDELIARLKRS